MDGPKLKVGSPVIVLGKNIEGIVAFIGVTQFSPGTLIFITTYIFKENGLEWY